MSYIMFVVTLLPDGSNNYFVDSQKSYKIALNNMVCPKGFEEYESMYMIALNNMVCPKGFEEYESMYICRAT